MIFISRYKYTPICDGCGATLAPEYDYFDAAQAAHRAGWEFVKPNTSSGEWFNYCPVCKARRKSNG